MKSNNKQNSVWMSFVSGVASFFGVRTAVSHSSESLSRQLDNFGKLVKINLKRNNNGDNVNFEEFINKNLSGKLRFRQRMINEELDESRYLKLNQKQYNYSLGILALTVLLGGYSLFMLLSSFSVPAVFGLLIISILYVDNIKKAAEIREQSFITLKEWVKTPKLWLPTTERINEYFNINNQDDLDKFYDEVAMQEQMIKEAAEDTKSDEQQDMQREKSE